MAGNEHIIPNQIDELFEELERWEKVLKDTSLSSDLRRYNVKSKDLKRTPKRPPSP